MEVEVCPNCSGAKHSHRMSSRDMGTVIGRKRFLVWQVRSGRRINTGMVDWKTRLYAWAPGDGKDIENFKWDGYMSFGLDEWATLIRLRVADLEFKDPSTRLLYISTMERAMKYARQDGTKFGERMLVPLGAFTQVCNDSGEIAQHAFWRYR